MPITSLQKPGGTVGVDAAPTAEAARGHVWESGAELEGGESAGAAGSVQTRAQRQSGRRQGLQPHAIFSFLSGLFINTLKSGLSKLTK